MSATIGERLSGMLLTIMCISKAGYTVEYADGDKIETFFVPIECIEIDPDPEINPDLDIKKGFTYTASVDTWVLYDNAILN